jgi:hypothetical protein
VRLAGCVANRSKDTDEVDRYCETVGFKRIAHMPDVDAIRRSRLKKKTLFEMPDDEDIVQCRAEYIRLAETLWNGTDPLAPRRWKTAISLSFWGSIDALALRPQRRHARPGRRLFRPHRDQDTRTWERLTSDAPVSASARPCAKA